MKRQLFSIATLLAAIAALSACTSMNSQSGWVTLFDGTKPKTLDNWNRIGEDNWRMENGAVVMDHRSGKDSSYLVSKNSYQDFQVRAEVWVSHDANSGIFFRASDPNKVGIQTAYEMNIYDEFATTKWGTGAIARRTEVDPMPKAGEKWSTFEVIAKGTHFTVFMDGKKTVELDDNTYPSGPIALQYAGGVVKWRKVEIKPL